MKMMGGTKKGAKHQAVVLGNRSRSFSLWSFRYVLRSVLVMHEEVRDGAEEIKDDLSPERKTEGVLFFLRHRQHSGERQRKDLVLFFRLEVVQAATVAIE